MLDTLVYCRESIPGRPGSLAPYHLPQLHNEMIVMMVLDRCSVFIALMEGHYCLSSI